MATVSFSLTIGSTPELEQLGEGLVGVAVVRAPGHVVEGEQHLPDDDAVPGELLGVAVHQQPLADRRRRLLGGQRAGSPLEAERGQAGGDGAGGDEHDLRAATAYVGEDVDQGGQAAGVEAAGGGGQRGRADLDDDALGVDDRPPGHSSSSTRSGSSRPPIS